MSLRSAQRSRAAAVTSSVLCSRRSQSAAVTGEACIRHLRREQFARVMLELGGVSQANEVVLRQPKLRELIDALRRAERPLIEARRVKEPAGSKSSSYYSGHADETGACWLGHDRYSYRTRGPARTPFPAESQDHAVIRSLRVGRPTRLKGGKKRPPFLVDEAAEIARACVPDVERRDEAAVGVGSHPRLIFNQLSSFRLPRGSAELEGDATNHAVTRPCPVRRSTKRSAAPSTTPDGAYSISYESIFSGSTIGVMTESPRRPAKLVLGDEDGGSLAFIRKRRKELV